MVCGFLGTPNAQAQPLGALRTQGVVHHLSFDDLDGDIGDHYPAVTFSPGWKTWKPMDHPDYTATSTPNVAFSHEEDNWIAFDPPAQRLRMALTYFDRDGASIDVVASDGEGRELERASVAPGSPGTVGFSSGDIGRIVVIGTGNWRTHFVIDDLTFVTLPSTR